LKAEMIKMDESGKTNKTRSVFQKCIDEKEIG